MSRTSWLLSSVAVAALSLGVYGCTSDSASDSGSSQPSNGGQHQHQANGGPDKQSADGGEDGDMGKIKAQLAKLSPEDRQLAEKQHICPVSGEMLGTMGAPQKVDVNGQQVWICCAGCKDSLLEEPDEYLAKLKE